MTLSDMLARGVRLELHEAVAVVRDIIERTAPEVHPVVPELHEVEILPIGRAELLGGGSAENPLEHLVKILRSLIGDAKVPGALTAVMEQRDLSLSAFAEALAYFERPNRTAVLQELHRRASGLEPLPEADALIASLRVAPPAAAPPQVEPAGSRIGSRHLLVGAGVLAAIALIVSGLLFSSSAGETRLPGLSGVTAAVGNAVSSVSERVGISAATPAAEPVAAPQPIEQSPGTAEPTAVRTATQKPRTQASGEPSTSTTLQQSRPPTATSQTRPTMGSSAEAVVPASGVDPAAIHTASTPGVVPPAVLRPHVPSDLPPGVPPENVAHIELVVGTDGLVESVKMLGQPPTVHEAMLLSAAKAWRFEPATKDGVPVRFRMTISVARDQR